VVARLQQCYAPLQSWRQTRRPARVDFGRHAERAPAPKAWEPPASFHQCSRYTYAKGCGGLCYSTITTNCCTRECSQCLSRMMPAAGAEITSGCCS
jgi:hypothetical protein